MYSVALNVAIPMHILRNIHYKMKSLKIKKKKEKTIPLW